MARRSTALQLFVDAADAAYDRFVQDPEARRASREIFTALTAPGAENPGAAARLPVCVHLDAALSVATEEPLLRTLLDRFAVIAPRLAWRRRPGDATASANFPDGHANATILGPGGLEERADVRLGALLLAPQVRYPDHDHPPEEVYLVLSQGEFRNARCAWFSPGIGGSLYNPPGIRHAVRAGATPVFAIWALQGS